MEGTAKQEISHMPDHPKPNVFAPEFLQRVRERTPPPNNAIEAILAGPWEVRPQ